MELRDHFSDQWPLLQKLIGLDSELNEICSDFILLAGEMENIPKDASARSQPQILDLKSSIEGLKAEILARVERHSQT